MLPTGLSDRMRRVNMTPGPGKLTAGFPGSTFFVLSAFLLAMTWIASAQEARDSSSQIPAAHAADERQRLETEKLKLEVEALRRQSETPRMQSVKDWGAPLQSFATVLSMIVGGYWVYSKYVRADERYPNVEFTADIHIIGAQQGFLLVELIAFAENKGKAQLKMEDLAFDLKALLREDPLVADERWRGQVNFPHSLCQGSFLPEGSRMFYVDPGTNARYSYLARVPADAAFLLLHCRFNYLGRGKQHTAEKTIQVPDLRRKNA